MKVPLPDIERELVEKHNLAVRSPAPSRAGRGFRIFLRLSPVWMLLSRDRTLFNLHDLTVWLNGYDTHAEVLTRTEGAGSVRSPHWRGCFPNWR